MAKPLIEYLISSRSSLQQDKERHLMEIYLKNARFFALPFVE